MCVYSLFVHIKKDAHGYANLFVYGYTYTYTIGNKTYLIESVQVLSLTMNPINNSMVELADWSVAATVAHPLGPSCPVDIKTVQMDTDLYAPILDPNTGNYTLELLGHVVSPTVNIPDGNQ